MVKGVNFVDLRDAGDPVELAARYDAEGADELVFLDITASSDQRDTIVDVVRRTAEQVFIPFTIGGGIRTVDDARRLLRAGADKVSVNTAAVERPALVAEISAEFGNQCVVVAIDGRRRVDDAGDPTEGWEVFTHGGRTPTGLDVVAWAAGGRAPRRRGDPADVHGPRRHPQRLRRRADLGGGRRGRHPGHRLGWRRHARPPRRGRHGGRADAVLAASIFHFGEHTVHEAKAHMLAAGVAVRP